MEKGDLLRFAEDTTDYALNPIVYESTKDYLAHASGMLTLKLLGLISQESAEGKKWASISTSADSTSPDYLVAARSVIAIVNQTMQEEGFQTDVAYAEQGENFVIQLTAFWADGKDIYEYDLHQLGQVDPAYLERIEESKIVNIETEFRPHIVEPDY